MSKVNGLNQVKDSLLLGKSILIRYGNEGACSGGEVKEVWYHEEDTGMDIVMETIGGLRTYVISMGYYNNLIEENK